MRGVPSSNPFPSLAPWKRPWHAWRRPPRPILTLGPGGGYPRWSRTPPGYEDDVEIGLGPGVLGCPPPVWPFRRGPPGSGRRAASTFEASAPVAPQVARPCGLISASTAPTRPGDGFPEVRARARDVSPGGTVTGTNLTALRPRRRAALRDRVSGPPSHLMMRGRSRGLADQLRRLAHPAACAIGETGLTNRDYSPGRCRSGSSNQLALAEETGLPLFFMNGTRQTASKAALRLSRARFPGSLHRRSAMLAWGLLKISIWGDGQSVTTPGRRPASDPQHSKGPALARGRTLFVPRTLRPRPRHNEPAFA